MLHSPLTALTCCQLEVSPTLSSCSPHSPPGMNTPIGAETMLLLQVCIMLAPNIAKPCFQLCDMHYYRPVGSNF